MLISMRVLSAYTKLWHLSIFKTFVYYILYFGYCISSYSCLVLLLILSSLLLSLLDGEYLLLFLGLLSRYRSLSLSLSRSLSRSQSLSFLRSFLGLLDLLLDLLSLLCLPIIKIYYSVCVLY